MLKNVVLPAPFGPIRLTMERSGMSKSTELTATSPPKTFVMPRALRILADSSFPSGHGSVFEEAPPLDGSPSCISSARWRLGMISLS